MPGPKRSTRGFKFAAKKPTIDPLLDVDAQITRTSTDFLKIDVEIALTFAGIALQSEHDPAKRQRNRINARRGYDPILRLLEKLWLDREDADFMTRNLRRLKSELQTLGETL